MNPGLVITSKQANDLSDLRRLNPRSLLVLFQTPTDLKCVEHLSKLEEIRKFPMVKMMSQNAFLLADMCKQSLDVLKTNIVYLVVYNDVLAGVDYEAYVKAFLNSIYLMYPDTLFVVCAAASQFFKKNSGARATLKVLLELHLAHSYGIMFSDSIDSMSYLDAPVFIEFAKENRNIEFILMQINKDNPWDISRIEEFKRPIIFWTIYAYAQHVPQEVISEIHSTVRPIALITPKRDRISVWDTKDMKGTVLRKIRMNAPDEFLVSIYGQIGELIGGGFVELIYFDIRYL